MVSEVLAVLAGVTATAVLFNVPQRALPVAPLAGLAGFLAAWLMEPFLDRPGCLFAAGLTVGLASEGLARLQRIPALVFSVPGILPLVPGSVAYRGMASAVRGEHAAAAEMLSLAVLSAGGIAMGLLLASALWRLPGKLAPSQVVEEDPSAAPCDEPVETTDIAPVRIRG
ncbi:MAG: threonine/serine exporter family protein [Candidatus Eremiobacterota bacterium]